MTNEQRGVPDTALDANDARGEIRELFDAWLRAAAEKDIDAVMGPIAEGVVSYEHNAPLQYVGREAVRAVCQEGFDFMQGEFRWDVRDLHVLVRGDIAVTWGLNHMSARHPTGDVIEQWSRGTRIFQKLGGKWKMIHQHVSFPVDPETGGAVTSAAPAGPP